MPLEVVEGAKAEADTSMDAIAMEVAKFVMLD